MSTEEPCSQSLIKIYGEGTLEEINNEIKNMHMLNIAYGASPNKALKSLFDSAVETNVFCYDINAEPGVFSKELMMIGCNLLFQTTCESLQFIIEDTTGLLKLWADEEDFSYISGKYNIILFVGSTKAVIGTY